MVNLTTNSETKSTQDIVNKEVTAAPKKVPAPIPNVNAWQVKKQPVTTTTTTANGKLTYLTAVVTKRTHNFKFRCILACTKGSYYHP
jgi:hypothetical protein